MSKKKSLGHNPLTYSKIGNANFDFIKSSMPDFDEPESQRPRQKSDPEKKVTKKVVSYYLDEEIVDDLKNRAESESRSYSSLVAKAIKNYLAEKNK